MSRFSCRLPAFVLLLLAGVTATAQDTHYWNLHYGSRATLLGGAVIGSVADLSATYYNPGQLGIHRDAGLLLTARAYDLTSLTVKEGSQTGKDVGQLRVSPSPNLVAGRFPGDSLSGSTLAYSILTRQSLRARLETKFVGQRDFLPDEPGDETGATSVGFETDLSEMWVGVTWSRTIGSGLGFGITTYGAYRGQENATILDGQALHGSGDLASLAARSEYRFYNVRLLWKAGLAYDALPWSFGLTVTTPGINLFGSGSSYQLGTGIGIDPDGNGVYEPVLIADYQQEVKSLYKSPWAVGFGAAYRLEEFTIDASAEWYGGVSQYQVLDTDPFTAQQPSDQYDPNLYDELESVVNWGIGVTYQAGARTSLYLSFVTDNSAAAAPEASNLTVTDWDIYHVTAGVLFQIGRADLTLGAGYAWGQSTLKESDSAVRKLLLGDLDPVPPGADLIWQRFRFIFALAYAL